MKAIECQNSQEWDVIRKKLNSKLKSYEIYHVNGTICMNDEGDAWCPTQWYIENKYDIIQARDFLGVNNYYSIL